MTRSARKYRGIEGVGIPFANYDDELKLLRKLHITGLFTAKKLKTYEMLRTQEMAAMVENVFSEIRSSNVEKGEDHPTNSAPVHIHSITAAVPRNIIFTLAVGKRFDSLPDTDELREYPAMVNEITKIIMEFNIV